MVIVSESKRLKQNIRSRKWLFSTTLLGFVVLLLPILFIFYDPILTIAKYYLRLANGTIIYNLMVKKVNGPRIYMNLFNVTNAKEFLSGRDTKLNLDEVGPFVYQEYRLNQDLRIDPETKLMSYTPRIWTEFIPEESFDDPKNVYLTMPNTPLLIAADLISKQSFFIHSLFNVFIASIKSKAFISISAEDYIWGYEDPILKYTNTILPGLFTFNSSGLFERFFNYGTNYKFEIGTKDEEKFSVKKITKTPQFYKPEANLAKSTQTFSNAYEGAAFPPGITPNMPLYIYRYSICKIFRLQYIGTTKTKYGSEAFVYDIANDTLNDHQLCDSQGRCPGGLSTLEPCFKNYQFGVSRGHLLGADPRLLERLEGIRPDKRLHSSKMIIDPIIGVALSTTASLQLNIVLRDLGYNTETKRFKDFVLPVCHVRFKSPELPSIAHLALVIMYIYGPYIVLAIKIICVLLGLGLLAYSTRMFFLTRRERPSVVLDTLLEKNMPDDPYIRVN